MKNKVFAVAAILVASAAAASLMSKQPESPWTKTMSGDVRYAETCSRTEEGKPVCLSISYQGVGPVVEGYDDTSVMVRVLDRASDGIDPYRSCSYNFSNPGVAGLLSKSYDAKPFMEGMEFARHMQYGTFLATADAIKLGNSPMVSMLLGSKAIRVKATCSDGTRFSVNFIVSQTAKDYITETKR